MLASPHYGERWGRHWMDIWRYSDWAGWSGDGQIRDSQPHIWRWRDWIVESLNEDKGYDRMILEMLAGRRARADGPEDACAPPASSSATGKMLNRETWLQDTVEHTAQAFLGVTLNCCPLPRPQVRPDLAEGVLPASAAVFEPHDVRIDRVPGEPDPTKDGLARV